MHRFPSLLPGGSPQTGQCLPSKILAWTRACNLGLCVYLDNTWPFLCSAVALEAWSMMCGKSLSCSVRGKFRYAGGKTEAITVLDCIFSRENHAYIVMDIMCWAGYWLHDCKSEFRMYWLGSKLQELPHQGRCGQSSFGFLPVPFHTCDSGTQSILAISGLAAFHDLSGL